MGKATNERNKAIAIANAKYVDDKVDDDLISFDDASNITGPLPIIIEKKSNEIQPIKNHALTVGSLIFVVTVVWGGYRAISEMIDRADAARRAAIAQHNESSNSHQDIRRIIEEIKITSKQRHDQLIKKLDDVLFKRRRRKRK